MSVMIATTLATVWCGCSFIDMPPIHGFASARKVGGIWFARLGQFRLTFCIARYPKPDGL